MIASKILVTLLLSGQVNASQPYYILDSPKSSQVHHSNARLSGVDDNAGSDDRTRLINLDPAAWLPIRVNWEAV